MAMKRLLSRGKSMLKTSPASREVLNISESIAVAEVNTDELSDSELNPIDREGHSVQNKPTAPTINSDNEGRVLTGTQRQSEKKSQRPPTFSPSRSASTSTRSSARTIRPEPHSLSPPPYSSLDGNPDPWAPSLSTGHSMGGRGGRMFGTPEQEEDGRRGKRRKNEEEEVEDRAELPRMIGYLTANEDMDWALIIELCERASASEANAKEAVKALRWEFKYAEPSAQFAAAQLWAIIFRNSSSILREQIQSQKFLDTLEDVLTSPRTSVEVKERLMEVLGAVAYAYGNDMYDARSQNVGLRDLWCRLKSNSDPEEGIPFDVDDEILNPSTPRATSVESFDPATHEEESLYLDEPQTSPTLERRRSDRTPRRERSLRISRRQKSIRLRNQIPSLDENTKRLYQECKIGRSNANLLLEVLEFAGSQDLKKEFIQELHNNCRESQQLIAAEIPGARIKAETRPLESPSPLSRKSPQRGLDRRTVQTEVDGSSLEMTLEEELLAALTTTNETLQRALRIYDNLERVTVERQAEEISRRFVSADRKHLRKRVNEYPDFLEETQRNIPGKVLRPLPPTPDDLTAMPRHLSSQRPSKGGYAALHNLKPLQVGDTLQVVIDKEDQPLEGPTSSKSFEKGKAVEQDQVDQAAAAEGIMRRSPGLATIFSLLPPSPEDLPTYNPWKPDPELSDSSDSCHTVEPTISPISPTRDQNTLRLPDFTGKIQREGEFPVGRGGFADVWRGVLQLQSGERNVAVKVLQARTHDSHLEQKISKRIRREIAIWQSLDHENVLPLLGITTDFGRYTSLVSPWLENGSLMQYLDKNSDSLGAGPRLQLACEVAAGLTYLHSNQVVHGDLTGANILVTDEGNACLCDFGLSALMIAFHGTSFYTSTVGGNARWAAPEIYRVTDDEVTRSVSVQTDVYSFGCIMLEIFSGQVPYHYLIREVQVLLELQNGNKPNRPTSGYISDTLWEIINACWADKPTDRPNVEEVWRSIKHQLILENLPC